MTRLNGAQGYKQTVLGSVDLSRKERRVTDRKCAGGPPRTASGLPSRFDSFSSGVCANCRRLRPSLSLPLFSSKFFLQLHSCHIYHHLQSTLYRWQQQVSARLANSSSTLFPLVLTAGFPQRAAERASCLEPLPLISAHFEAFSCHACNRPPAPWQNACEMWLASQSEAGCLGSCCLSTGTVDGRRARAFSAVVKFSTCQSSTMPVPVFKP
jgi:hypothetical protein